jgi:hypothetical protein
MIALVERELLQVGGCLVCWDGLGWDGLLWCYLGQRAELPCQSTTGCSAPCLPASPLRAGQRRRPRSARGRLCLGLNRNWGPP